MSDAGVKFTSKIRQTRFPISLFFVLFAVLLLMPGVHSGFVVLVSTPGWEGWMQTAAPLANWVLVAYGLTMYTKWHMTKSYDEPMGDLPMQPHEWQMVT